MREVSKAETWRQVKREGARWGIVPMRTVFGDVVAAEDIPCVLPLAPGIDIVERVRRDITGVSMSYPWSSLLRGRKQKSERSASLRREIAHLRWQAEVVARKQELLRALESDIRQADKGRLIFVR